MVRGARRRGHLSQETVSNWWHKPPMRSKLQMTQASFTATSSRQHPHRSCAGDQIHSAGEAYGFWHWPSDGQGIARPHHKAGFTQTMLGSSSSHQSGTHLYMAPEVVAGKPATPQSNIYSLGVLFYQLLV